MTEQPTWPIGKFKGQFVRDIPHWHLRWAVKNFTWLKPWYKMAAQAIIDGEPVPAWEQPERKPYEPGRDEI
jgi:hypothetical protein